MFPCFAFAAADPVGVFQGAVNPYSTMGQGAVQELTIITSAGTAPCDTEDDFSGINGNPPDAA